MTTFVLIPGAGGTAWYWSRVVPLLESAGHRAIAVDLPGDDPAAGLEQYADLAVAAARGHDDVTLVAQSLGGFTAAETCTRIDVVGLVFVNAMIPAGGESAGEWWEATGWEQARVAAAQANGYSTDFDLATYFLHDVDPEVAAEGEPYQRPEADAVFAGRCSLQRWPDVPIRAVAGSDDRFFPVDFQRRLAHDRLGIDADVLPGGHLIALANAPALAGYLLAAAP